MNNMSKAILSMFAIATVCVGCSQGSRDEAIDRATQAAKALNGKADNTPDVVKEQIRKEKERQNSTWTIENVTAHPLEACNAKLEEIEEKINKANIAYNSALSKQAAAKTKKNTQMQRWKNSQLFSILYVLPIKLQKKMELGQLRLMGTSLTRKLPKKRY